MNLEASTSLFFESLATGALIGAIATSIYRRIHTAQDDAADTSVLMRGTSAEGSILAIGAARDNRRSMWRDMFMRGATSVFLVLALAIGTPAHAKSEGSADVVKGLEEKATQGGKAQPLANSRVKVETYFLEVTGKPKGLSGLLKDQSPGTSTLALSAPSAKTVESILKGVEKVKGVRVLSAPKMTVFSNRKASFTSIREMPYATDWAKAANTGEWGAVSFAKKDVGIKLAVTPEVKADGTINLRMVPEVTQFEGFLNLDAPTSSSGGVSPRKQAVFHTQRLASEVLLNPGDTVVISGAESANSSEIVDKVPLLGDLPIIGGLFRSTVRPPSRVLILVTARILSPGEITADK